MKFLFSFWGCGYKNILQIQNRDIPLKQFLETLNLFSQPEFPEQWGGLLKLDLLQELTVRINTKSLFFPGNSGLENKLGVSKNLLGRISLSIISLNRFAIAAPNENKKFQKILL